MSNPSSVPYGASGTVPGSAVSEPAAYQATAPGWCRACGVIVAGPAQTCSHCGVPLAAPDRGPARIGRVVVMPTKLLTRHGVAVAEADGSVLVLSKGDSPTPMPTAQFDQLPAPPMPGPAVTSAPGRLWAANHAAQSGAIKGKWSAPTVAAAAEAGALASVGSRRAAAVDAIALGHMSVVDGLQLSQWEISWYQAWTAGANADVAGLLRCLEALPPTGYHERVSLLLRYSAALFADPALAGRAVAVLGSFVGVSADAWALSRALRPAVADDLAGVVAYAGQVARTGGPAFAGIQPMAEAVRRRERLPALPPIAAPSLRAFDAYLAGRAASSVDGAVDSLAPLPTVLLDDLIAAGSLTRLEAGKTPWLAEVTAYVRCRLHPGLADVADLRAAGFTAELARRFFLSGDTGQLAALPSDDAAVRHYRALHSLRATGRADQPEWLRPAARSIMAIADDLRSATEHQPREAPAEFAADGSAWPLVQETAFRGAILVSDGLRARYPEFAEWLELCGMQRPLFDGRWDEVIATGRRIAESCSVESICDEAQNMMAFAEWQLGRPDEALLLLESALRGEFTTGLVVNAALVASDHGSLAALGYLDRAMRLSTDPRVRQGALSRAVGLWLQDDNVRDYPKQLADMVHDALLSAQPDDAFHRTLLVLSANNDAIWLASAIPHATDRAQADAVRYFQTRARVLSDQHRETLKDVAEVLVALWPNRPDWVERERTWLCELLVDLVHCDFGDAIGLVEPIEVLVRGQILDLVEQLVLTAQAGAHVAVGLNNNGANIAPEAERRLLFEPAQIFRNRRGELSERAQEIVGEELARCLSVSVLAVGGFTENRWTAFLEQWNVLVQRERWDHANRYQIISLERALLDDIDPFIARCRDYLVALRGLPLNDGQRHLHDTVAGSVTRWGAESARLRSLL